ncbi:MAG: D-2-hydroxyacid dehydrogenase [Bryobacteraceae bacterium]
MKTLSLCLLLASSSLWAQPKKILMFGSPEAAAKLQQKVPGARLVAVTPQTALAQVADADAVIGNITPEMVRKGARLKWFHVTSAGVERYLHLSGPELMNSDITVTNAKIVQGPEIADHAMALLLNLTRGLNRIVPRRSEENWERDRDEYQAIELNEKTAVIIGVGGIGTQIAARAHAFGMKVIGVDPKDIPYMPFIERVVHPDRLDEVIPLADVVFISAPHTRQSHKMVGPKQFASMKRGAYFIAVSRGGLYDMPSLVKALDSKMLAGAGVDVTDPEPLPKGHPLWKFQNAVITPHIATRSDLSPARRDAILEDNLRRFVEGRPLIHVVDKQKGY